MKNVNFKDYPIFKKRDGQQWEQVNTIYANGFIEAKKKFAKMMTDDNFSKSNNIIWLTKENDGVEETGFYDFSGGIPLYNEDTEKYDSKEAKDFLMVTEKSINKGFAYWNEDVYSWELRKK